MHVELLHKSACLRYNLILVQKHGLFQASIRNLKFARELLEELLYSWM